MGVERNVAETSREPFEAFFTDTWPDLFAFAATLTAGDLALAEDLVQEAMARVYPRFASLQDPRPYAFKVTSNLLRARWKHARHESITDPSVLPELGTPRGHDHTLDAVRRLPSRLRDVVVLHYYADLPLETVARQVRRPLGTVKQRLHEARAQLAVTLAEEAL